jgi:hypothetical protein
MSNAILAMDTSATPALAATSVADSNIEERYVVNVCHV